MKLVDITRNAENQLATAARNSAARFLSSRKEKNRAEYLARLNLEVASLVELHQKLHSSPPGQVVEVPPLPPVGSSLSPSPLLTPKNGFNL